MPLSQPAAERHRVWGRGGGAGAWQRQGADQQAGDLPLEGGRGLRLGADGAGHEARRRPGGRSYHPSPPPVRGGWGGATTIQFFIDPGGGYSALRKTGL